MIITIKVPDNATVVQYNSEDENGFEMWKPLKFGEIISVQKETEEAVHDG